MSSPSEPAHSPYSTLENESENLGDDGAVEHEQVVASGFSGHEHPFTQGEDDAEVFHPEPVASAAQVSAEQASPVEVTVRREENAGTAPAVAGYDPSGRVSFTATKDIAVERRTLTEWVSRGVNPRGNSKR